MDLVVSAELKLFIGKGNCQFVAQQDREPAFTNSGSSTLFSVDLDRDGDMDVLSPPYVYMNQLIDEGGLTPRDTLPTVPIDITAVGDAKMRTPIGAQV